MHHNYSGLHKNILIMSQKSNKHIRRHTSWASETGWSYSTNQRDLPRSSINHGPSVFSIHGRPGDNKGVSIDDSACVRCAYRLTILLQTTCISNLVGR